MRLQNASGAALLGAAWFVACTGRVSLGSPDTPSADAGKAPATAADAGVGAHVREGGPGAGSPGEDASSTSGTDAATGAGPGSGCGGMQFDPHNCGTCGNDCMGGACQGGVCAPLPVGALATGQLSPTSLVVDATNVYWVNEGMPSTSLASNQLGPVQILKCAKSGCNNNPTVLVSNAPVHGDGGRLRGLAVDGTNVYWTSDTGLFACALEGCNDSPTVLHRYDGTDVGGWPGVAPEIAVGSGMVYASDPDSAYSFAVDADAGYSGPLWTLGSSGRWMWLGVDATRAYIGTTDGEIVSCTLGGCGGVPTLLVSAPMSPSPTSLLGRLALDDTNIYWALGAGILPSMPVKNGFVTGCAGTGQVPPGEILKCAKGGCGDHPTTLVSGLSCPTGVVTDGASVYFTEPEYFGGGPTPGLSDAATGRIARCDVAGCSNQPTPLAEKLNNPRGIAVDASHVYWTDFGSGGTLPARAITDPLTPPYTDDGRIMMIAK